MHRHVFLNKYYLYFLIIDHFSFILYTSVDFSKSIWLKMTDNLEWIKYQEISCPNLFFPRVFVLQPALILYYRLVPVHVLQSALITSISAGSRSGTGTDNLSVPAATIGTDSLTISAALIVLVENGHRCDPSIEGIWLFL
jgi:hypothetical protein